MADTRATFDKKSMYYKYSSFFYDANDNLDKVGIPFQDFSFAKYKIYRISPSEEFRPDLLSIKFYGTPSFDWIICTANMIKDPIAELTVGKRIVIPEIPQEYLFS